MVFIRTREHSISHSDILDTVSARCLLSSKCLMFNFNLFYLCKISKLFIYSLWDSQQYKTVSGYEKKCSKLLHNICAQYCFGHFLLEILEILKLLQIVIRECWSVGVDFRQTKHLLTRRGLIVWFVINL